MDEEAEITQEDAWAVISAYFEEKGLVRQQLDSFNEFINSNMQVRGRWHCTCPPLSFPPSLIPAPTYRAHRTLQRTPPALGAPCEHAPAHVGPGTLRARGIAGAELGLASQEIVDENAEILVIPENQYNPSGERAAEGAEHEIRFGQIYLSKPTITEADGETSILFPKEARLRNLTCAPRPWPRPSLYAPEPGPHTELPGGPGPFCA